jgi:hypothetical protein
MKTAKEARRGGGLRRCSEERRAAPTCPASGGRSGGEERGGHLRVEGLGCGSHRWRRSAARLG